MVFIPELEITRLSGTFQITDFKSTAKPESDYRLISGHETHQTFTIKIPAVSLSFQVNYSANSCNELTEQVYKIKVQKGTT